MSIIKSPTNTFYIRSKVPSRKGVDPIEYDQLLRQADDQWKLLSDDERQPWDAKEARSCDAYNACNQKFKECVTTGVAELNTLIVSNDLEKFFQTRLIAIDTVQAQYPDVFGSGSGDARPGAQAAAKRHDKWHDKHFMFYKIAELAIESGEIESAKRFIGLYTRNPKRRFSLILNDCMYNAVANHMNIIMRELYWSPLSTPKTTSNKETLDKIELLLLNGADPNSELCDGRLLFQAAIGNDRELAKLLVQFGADIDCLRSIWQKLAPATLEQAAWWETHLKAIKSSATKRNVITES